MAENKAEINPSNPFNISFITDKPESGKKGPPIKKEFPSIELKTRQVTGYWKENDEATQKRTGQKGVFTTIIVTPFPEGGHRDFITHYRISNQGTVSIEHFQYRMSPDGFISIESFLSEFPSIKQPEPFRLFLGIEPSPEKEGQQVLKFAEIIIEKLQPKKDKKL